MTSHDDLLVAVLEEAIYLLDTAGEAQVNLTLTGTDGGVDVDFTMVDASTPTQVGARAKGVIAQRASLLAWSRGLALRGNT